ncbi:MAG: hypothetical protein CL610_15440 [Anaerolineaceae bacterium]|nr:hypothetical protein [Anaerolineaceae bacterium]
MHTKFWASSVIILFLALSFFTRNSKAQPEPTATPEPSSAMSGMGQMETAFSSDDLAPLVRGIYEGDELFFIHTEASDLDVASLLTEMMGPQVVTVPGLADIPDELLGNVYVFTNGVNGGGPMGFQPDIFDSIPGDEVYTPLRALNLVTWQAGAAPRMLDSVAEIEAAQAKGEVVIERPGIVVNMPILVWPGGQR